MRSIGEIIFLLCCTFIWQSSCPKNVKLILHLDDYLCSEEQWLYIRGYNTVVSGSEYFIFDSAYIAKGQHLVELNYYIPYEHTQYFLFSKMGPDGFYFEAEPDMTFEIDLGKEDGEAGGTKMIKGGTAHNESILFYDHVINPLKNKITECSAQDPLPLDSIDYYNKQIAVAYIDAMKSTKHPVLAESYYLMLRAFHSSLIGYDKIEELKLYIQNKFHDYKPIQDLGLTPAPKPSEEARRVAARLKEISEGRNYVTPQDTVIGAQVSLLLPDMEGSYISTDNLISEYVLVDFWASWCAPCRKESPYLKEALSTYGSLFSIYAVTLDSDLNACMQVIEKDGTEDFIHVKGILGGRFPCYAVRRLGARTIPANFLLDKDRRIVAKNLRGEELLNLLEQLTEKK